MKQENYGIMVFQYFMAIITFLFCISGCMKWEYNKVINGIEFSKIRYETSNGDTISIIGYLTTKKIIEGYPCDEDWVHFTKDWNIKLLKLSEKSMVNNYNYPEGTWIKFDSEHNVICVFPKNTIVQGYLCMGDGGVKGISTSFYKNGKLHSFFSENEVLIGDTFCLGGVLNNIELYETGALKECTLSRDKEVSGILYSKHSRIYFDEKGNIISSNN